MRRPLPIAQSDQSQMRMRTLDVSTQELIEPHMVELPVIGMALIHHAQAINLGRIGVKGNLRIMIQLAMPGCQCGCASPGQGMIYTPEPASARALAADLIRLADDCEAEATAAAEAAIDAARKPRP